MRKSWLAASSFALVLLVMLTSAAWGLFHGYFDGGKFEITQIQWSSPRGFALVGRRSDHQSLNGDQYFVLIGDHPLAPAELKRAYYSREVLFRAGSCLTVRWKDPRTLVVTCRDGSIQADQIGVEERRKGDVEVLYENIPKIVR